MIAGIHSLAAIREEESEEVASKLRTDSPMSIPSIVGTSSSDGSEASYLDSPYASPATPRQTISSSPMHIFTPISSLVHGRSSPTPKNDDNDVVVGITKPSYQVNEFFESTRTTPITSNVQRKIPTRIGITPSKYEQPNFPTSPANLFLMQHAAMMEKQQQDYVAPPSNIYFSEGSCRSKNVHGDGIERTLHKPTAGGHFLVSASTAVAHPHGLRFDLGKGKAEICKDETNLVSGMKEVQVSSSSCNSTGSSVTTLSTSVASSVQSCATPFKVFCLLLHPQAKIFELIQIIYSPDVTTVGDLLHLIPENASEAVLGMQDYVALCRPKDGASRQGIHDVDAMASPGNHDEESSGIKCGEILVPIPSGYTVEQMANMSRAILKNPKILGLLQKSNPLAPGRKSKVPFEVHSTSSKMFLSPTLDGVREEDQSSKRRKRRKHKKERKHAAEREVHEAESHEDPKQSQVEEVAPPTDTSQPQVATLPPRTEPQTLSSKQEASPTSPEISPPTLEKEPRHRHHRRNRPGRRLKKVFSILRSHTFGFHHHGNNNGAS